MILHLQAKIWVNYNCKSIPWAFFIVNNRDFPNCDQVQQLKCSICFPYIVPLTLIKTNTKGKRGIISYNTFFGSSSMKRHVESEHLELLTSYIEKVSATNNISRSQIVGDQGTRAIQPTNKSSKVTPGAIFNFFGRKFLTYFFSNNSVKSSSVGVFFDNLLHCFLIGLLSYASTIQWYLL